MRTISVEGLAIDEASDIVNVERMVEVIAHAGADLCRRAGDGRRELRQFYHSPDFGGSDACSSMGARLPSRFYSRVTLYGAGGS